MDEQRYATHLIERSQKVKYSVFTQHKQKLFAGISGTVLEIGPGAGMNLPYYPNGIQWIGVEPNQFLRPYLKEKLEKLQFKNWKLEGGDGERLPMPAASVDAVVSTMVLCSVAHPMKMLAEIKRVLKPGGTFYFMEHVGAPKGTLTRLKQDIMNPFVKRLISGCDGNRDTFAVIQAAGFERVMSDQFTIGRFLPMPFIIGTAQK